MRIKDALNYEYQYVGVGYRSNMGRKVNKIRITKEFDDICYERMYETHVRVFVILMSST